MKTAIIQSFLFSGLLFGLHAQTYTLSNQHHYGTTLSDFNPKTLKTNDGGYIIAATSYGNDVDHASNAYGGADFWIIKLNSSYSIEWEKGFGGTEDDFANTIAETSDGNFLIGGYSFSGVSGSKTSASYGLSDYWLIKITPTGELIWQQSYGTADSDILYKLIVKSENEYLLCGSSVGGINGNKTIASYGQSDTWLIKTDSSGVIQSQFAFGGTSAEIYTNMFAAGNNQYIVSCTTDSPVSGNKNSPAYGYNDSWIILLDENMNVVSENTFGGNSDDWIIDLTKKNNTFVLVGYSQSDISGNKTSSLLGPMDAWMLTLDNELNILTDVTFGGSYSTFEHIQELANGKFLATGVASNGTNPWKTRPSLGSGDIWLVGFDNNLNYEWNYSFGGNAYDGEAICFESSNNHFVIFGMTESASFSGDLTHANYGVFDIWQTELTTTVGLDENISLKPDIFPNPFSQDLVINAGNNFELYDLFSAEGKLIETGIINANKIVFSQVIHPGSYLLILKSAQEESAPIRIIHQ